MLQAAKELGQRENKTAGQMISELARLALNAALLSHPKAKASDPKEFHGFRPFASRGSIITNESINKLREDDIY